MSNDWSFKSESRKQWCKRPCTRASKHDSVWVSSSVNARQRKNNCNADRWHGCRERWKLTPFTLDMAFMLNILQCSFKAVYKVCHSNKRSSAVLFPLVLQYDCKKGIPLQYMCEILNSPGEPCRTHISHGLISHVQHSSQGSIKLKDQWAWNALGRLLWAGCCCHHIGVIWL